jgi:hypothetical protein
LVFHHIRGGFITFFTFQLQFTNCNSSTSDVGGSHPPRLSEYALLMRLIVPSSISSSTTRQSMYSNDVSMYRTYLRTQEPIRVAILFLVQHAKTGKNILNQIKIRSNGCLIFKCP